MEQKTDRFYPSAPFENKNDDLEQSLGKELNDVKSFNNHINNLTEMNTYLKDKIHNSKNKYKNYRTQNTILESVDTFAIIGSTSTSMIVWITGTGLIILPILAGTACTLSLGNKVLHKLIINKYNKYKKQSEKNQQTIKKFDKFDKKFYKIMKLINESENLWNKFTKYLEDTKIESFLKR